MPSSKESETLVYRRIIDTVTTDIGSLSDAYKMIVEQQNNSYEVDISPDGSVRLLQPHSSKTKFRISDYSASDSSFVFTIAESAVKDLIGRRVDFLQERGMGVFKIQTRKNPVKTQLKGSRLTGINDEMAGKSLSLSGSKSTLGLWDSVSWDNVYLGLEIGGSSKPPDPPPDPPPEPKPEKPVKGKINLAALNDDGTVLVGGFLSMYNGWLIIAKTEEEGMIFALHKVASNFALQVDDPKAAQYNKFYLYAANNVDDSKWPAQSGIAVYTSYAGVSPPASKPEDCTLWKFIGEKFEFLMCLDSVLRPGNTKGQMFSLDPKSSYLYAKTKPETLKKVRFAVDVIEERRSLSGKPFNLFEWLELIPEEKEKEKGKEEEKEPEDNVSGFLISD